MGESVNKKTFNKLRKGLKRLHTLREKLGKFNEELDDLEGWLVSDFYDFYIEQRTGKSMDELRFKGDDLFDALHNHDLKEFEKRLKEE